MKTFDFIKIAILLFAFMTVLVSCGHRHTVVPAAEMPATCTENGVAAHFECSSCGAKFSDAEGKNGVGESDLTLSALGHKNDNLDCFCDVCGKLSVTVSANGEYQLSPVGSKGEDITAALKNALEQGARSITINGELSEEILNAVSAALVTLDEEGTLSLSLPDMENIGAELNGARALPGYFKLKNGAFAVYNEKGLLAWGEDTRSAYPVTSLVLTSDIEMSAREDGTGNWTPISTFMGSINGNGYSIIGLTVLCPDNNNVAFIGNYPVNSPNQSIENLNFKNAYISGKICCSVIVANVYKDAKIINCSVSGSVNGICSLGGICGINSGRIIACSNYAEINGTETHVGGIVGQTLNDVIGCINGGKVTITNGVFGASAGGVSGSAFRGRIVACISTAEVSSAGDFPYAGGIAGTSSATLKENYWSSPTAGKPVFGVGGSMSENNAKRVKDASGWSGVIQGLNNALAAESLDYRFVVDDEKLVVLVKSEQ